MSKFVGLLFNKENVYENPFTDKIKFVGYKTHKMKRIKVLKEGQFEIKKNKVSLKDISLGTGDKVYIEV